MQKNSSILFFQFGYKKKHIWVLRFEILYHEKLNVLLPHEYERIKMRGLTKIFDNDN